MRPSAFRWRRARARCPPSVGYVDATPRHGDCAASSRRSFSQAPRRGPRCATAAPDEQPRNDGTADACAPPVTTAALPAEIDLVGHRKQITGPADRWRAAIAVARVRSVSYFYRRGACGGRPVFPRLAPKHRLLCCGGDHGLCGLRHRTERTRPAGEGSVTGMATVERSAPAEAASPTFNEALKVWLKIGCLSFGGPAGQIAMMHRVLVDEKKWIDEPRFLHALNFSMLTPGPEAQKLATYIGWLLHGVRGGLTAGILFVAAWRAGDAGAQPALRARPRHPAGRRRAVRHQGRGACHRRRGADPHRQARAQNRPCCSALPARRLSVSSFSPAVSAHRRRRGADRISCRRIAPALLGLKDDVGALAPPAPDRWRQSAIAALIGLAAWWAPVALGDRRAGLQITCWSASVCFSPSLRW